MSPNPAASEALLKAFGNRAAALNVAEVGCGSGARCRLWAGQGHQTYGADMSADAIALARRHAHQEGLAVLLDVASECALPWPDRSMDLCIACEVLDASSDWRRCLAECLRVLRPSGALYVTIGPLPWSARKLRRELARHGARCLAMPGSGFAPLRWFRCGALLAFKPAA